MTSDACRELRAALGAVALGGADPAEALALRAHLDGCPECRAELRELTSVAAALPLADPWRARGGLSQPPPTLAKRVLGRVAAERTARRRASSRAIAPPIELPATCGRSKPSSTKNHSNAST